MTTSATRPYRPPHLRSDAAGAVSTELVVVIALVCLAGLGAWAMLGTNVELAVRCAAADIALGTSGDCGAGAVEEEEGAPGAGDDGSVTAGRGSLTEDDGAGSTTVAWPDAPAAEVTPIALLGDRVLAENGGEVSPIALAAPDREALGALAGEIGEDPGAAPNVVHWECTDVEIARGSCRRPAPQSCDWLDLACLAGRAGDAVNEIATAVVDGAQTVADTVAGGVDLALDFAGWVGDRVFWRTTENITEGAGAWWEWPLDLLGDIGGGLINVAHAGFELACSTVRNALVDVFWRTAENLGDGAGEWWEWPLDLGADLVTLPLQMGGNLLKEVADVPLNLIHTMLGAMGPASEAAWTERVHWGAPTADGPPRLYVPNDPRGAEISASDVGQGRIGDCGTMAAIAAVAFRNPEVIRNAIRDNGDGTYTVTFWERGEFPWEPKWQEHEVTVDATLPLDDYGRPLYAETPDGELWPAILEKAWAVYNEGYPRVNGGFEFGVLEALTGRPARYSNTLIEQFFQLLPGPSPRAPSLAEMAAWDAQGQATTTGVLQQVESLSGPPLITRHVYYVTDVDEVRGTVTLRNPWGWEYGETVVSYASFAEAVGLITTADTGLLPAGVF